MILVCAANGRIGSRVISELIASGQAENLVAGVRDPESYRQQESHDIPVRYLDYEEVESIESAMQGIERVVLIPSFADTDSRARQAINVVQAAAKQGVGQIVFVGFMDIRLDSPLPITRAYASIEGALHESGVPATILRTSMYTDNLEEQFPVWLERGELMTCAGDGKISYVPRDDIARAIVGVLTAPVGDHAGKTYKLTGPVALSYDEVREIISGFFDTGIEMKHVNVDEFAEGLKQIWGVAYPEFEHVARITPLFQLVFKQGIMSEVTNHVELLSGTPPEDVGSWLQRNVDRDRYLNR